MEDNIIVDLIYSRNEKGIKETSIKYGKLIFSIAKGVLFNTEESEECENDTYMKIWDTIPPYRPEFYRAFVCKITRRLSLDRYRYSHRAKRSEDSTVALDELDYEIEGKDFLGEHEAETVLKRDINSFLESLDIKSRTLFIRRYFLFESISDISEKLGISENSVSVKLFRVRKDLKKHLIKRGYRIE